jgi:hypothetical protein
MTPLVDALGGFDDDDSLAGIIMILSLPPGGDRRTMKR